MNLLFGLNFENGQTVIYLKNLDAQSDNEAKKMINVDSSQGKNGCGSSDRIFSGQKKRRNVSQKGLKRRKGTQEGCT